MNIAQPKKVVLLGFLSHFPVAGVAWQTIHYLVGLQRLGYEVYYVEAHGCTPGKLMQSETDDGPARAAAYISGILERFGLGGHWAYHSLYDSRYLGLSEQQLKALYRSAEVIFNLHGSHLPNAELTATGRLAYVETDPVDVEIDLFHRRKETVEYLEPHCAFFTYGENLGRPDCLVPAPAPFKFLPTRQPVVLEFWDNFPGVEAKTFTTIGNWRQPWRQITFKGERYRWSKDLEFQKFIDLPRRTSQEFELALSSYNASDRLRLQKHGWRVRHALDISRELQPYREYVCNSRGEFTVAKDQNVRLRSGWFSDRAATYLAAGRPVVTQETGFSDILPTGKGLFAFSNLEEIVAAVEAINADYERHRQAAQDIAREYFSHEVVLGAMLRELGVVSKPAPGPRNSYRSALPSGLVLAPVSRWPTRLPEETVQTASGLSAPTASMGPSSGGSRASIIMVTHNGLPYTKMCLASLLGDSWYSGDELVIVDNASTDGTPAFLREVAKRNPFVRLCLNSENAGFANGNNQGVQLASGDVLILLNNDTIVLRGWRDTLVRWLEEPGIGMVGPVTNRTCNEAQIDAPYRTYEELERFAHEYTRTHEHQANNIPMLAFYCVAIRRHVFERVGPLDEGFEIGMFEDDDYALRLRQAGYRIICAEDLFVHHFGQASLGELCETGEYDLVLQANRRRYEEKWGIPWQPHGRRITPGYQQLRQRVQEAVATRLPSPATVLVVSKGDEELLKLDGQRGWHFPQNENGGYANLYPADGREAVAHLEAMRAKGAQYLVIPKPAFWWLEHYGAFKDHLERRCRLAVREPETCLIYSLGGSDG